MARSYILQEKCAPKYPQHAFRKADGYQEKEFSRSILSRLGEEFLKIYSITGCPDPRGGEGGLDLRRRSKLLKNSSELLLTPNVLR